MSKKIRAIVQHFLIQTNRIPLFFYFSKQYYHTGVVLFSFLSKFFVSDIISVYVRNSYVTGAWIPWVSDVDFTITLSCASSSREAAALTRLWQLHTIFKIVFPFIQHIAVFSREEFRYIFDSHDPSFALAMGDMRKVGSKDRMLFLRKKTPSSLRIHDWVRFCEWLSRYDCSELVSFYRYERFLRKFPPLNPGSAEARALEELLADPRQMHDVSSFVRSGFYYANSIVASFRDAIPPGSIQKSVFVSYAIRENIPDFILKIAEDYAARLNVCAGAVAGVMVDSNSLCAGYPRLWIFMRNGISKDLWEATVNFIWMLGRKTSQATPVYIFDEYAIEVFLHTQRYWAFEYAHLMNHRRMVWGEDTIARMRAVPDDCIRKMAFPSLLLKRAALRESIFTHSYQQLQVAAHEMFRLRVLCEYNVLVTTRQEPARASLLLSKDDEYFLIEDMMRQKDIDRKKLFEVWSVYARSVEENCQRMLSLESSEYTGISSISGIYA